MRYRVMMDIVCKEDPISQFRHLGITLRVEYSISNGL